MSTTPTPFDRLLPVWSHILDFLAPSLPKPLSGWTKGEAIGESEEMLASLPDDGAPGATTRRDIRAPELAVLMRTSIAFNQLASRPLYRRVITDRFVGLVRNHNRPSAHRHIDSKQELLSHIHYLHLEYSKKGVDPTYTQILSQRGHMSAIGFSVVSDMAIAQSSTELHELYLSFVAVGSGPNPFPNVHTATLCAIFGSLDKIWALIAMAVVKANGASAWHEHPMQISHGVLAYILKQTQVVHFCQRINYGPLSLPDRFSNIGSLCSPQLDTRMLRVATMHVGMSGQVHQNIPLALGHRTRWVIERHVRLQDASTICDLIQGDLQRTGSGLIASAAVLDRPSESKIVDLEIFASSNHQRPVPAICALSLLSCGGQDICAHGEMNICREVRDHISRAWKEGELGSEVASLDWQPWSACPPCQACGWSVSDRAACQEFGEIEEHCS